MARAGTLHKGGQKEGTVRPKFTDYWKQKDIVDYFDWVRKNYKKNPRLATWVGDHLVGKAVQPIGNDGDKPFMVSGVEIKVR